MKTDKNRTRLEEVFLKTTHLARNEAAAARREEKKRKEKERILQVKNILYFYILSFILMKILNIKK